MTNGASAPYDESMRAALATVVALVGTLTAGCGASSAHTSITAVARGPLLAGQVLVVATPSGGVHICGNQNSDLMLGPPGCSPGPRAVGLQTDMLTGHSSKPDERWGYLYLEGHYGHGTFSVTSQRLHVPPTEPAGTVTFDKTPCAAPRDGWLLRTPSQAQRSTVEHYSRLAHHRDLVDIAFYDHGSILTVASSHPARTREVLARHWPRQLCVLKARYSRATLIGVGKRMVRLMTSSRSPSYGWINGAGGTCGSNNGQPKTCVEVLLETPKLRALARSLPQGLLGVDPVLRPVRRAR